MDLLALLVTNNSFKSFSESKPFSEADEEVPDGELNEEEVQDENIEEPIEETDDDDTDPFLMEAMDVVVETGQASTSFIQRKFKVGYARAGRIIDQLEERGVISGYQGSKPRQVLMTLEKLKELKMSTSSNTNE